MIYTAGYAGWRLRHLEELVELLGVTVVDVRHSPRSANPQWSQRSLSSTFGELYLHAPELGNTRYRERDGVELADPQAAVDGDVGRLLEGGEDLLLLCGCREWQTCHRVHAATFLALHAGTGVVHVQRPVEDLETWR